jgi:acyl-CoA thioesterase FadM
MKVIGRSGYRFVVDVPTLTRHFIDGHLNAAAAAELLLTARSAYLKRAVAWSGIGPNFWLIYRRLEIDYLSEAFEGESFACGVRTMAVGRRSVRLGQTLWTVGDERPVLRGASVEVAFDVSSRRAVELPAGLINAIGAYEGPDAWGRSEPARQ